MNINDQAFVDSIRIVNPELADRVMEMIEGKERDEQYAKTAMFNAHQSRLAKNGQKADGLYAF